MSQNDITVAGPQHGEPDPDLGNDLMWSVGHVGIPPIAQRVICYSFAGAPFTAFPNLEAADLALMVTPERAALFVKLLSEVGQ